MWEIRNIEKITERALIKDLGQVEGASRFADYLTARRILLDEILEEIRGTQPSLTDHGPDHIRNVMDNAGELLGTEDEILQSLTGLDLYCLLLSILFHDAGNIFDRKEHQRKITKIYDHVRPADTRRKDEKYIVIKAVEAHAGYTSDGSYDTLKNVDETCPFVGKPVVLRVIAAVLRFADELAEGPQRTSNFMHKHKGYPPDSQIYHNYARIVSVFIDRSNGRIALTYNLEMDLDAKAQFTQQREDDLIQLLGFTYKRIMKLEQERQYARHYCDPLLPFKKTTVVFNFWINGELVDLGLAEARLTGVVVPGDFYKDFAEYHPSYNLDALITKLRDKL